LNLFWNNQVFSFNSNKDYKFELTIETLLSFLPEEENTESNLNNKNPENNNNESNENMKKDFTQLDNYFDKNEIPTYLKEEKGRIFINDNLYPFLFDKIHQIKINKSSSEKRIKYDIIFDE